MIYQYRCPDHGKFELVGVPMNESDEPRPCPECEEPCSRDFDWGSCPRAKVEDGTPIHHRYGTAFLPRGPKPRNTPNQTVIRRKDR